MQARHAGVRHCDPEPGKGNPGSGCRLTSVTVMQSAQPRQCDDVALVWRFDGSGERTILVEKSVGPILVIVGQIIGENLAEVRRIEDNDVVQTLAANRADDPFDHGILPRRPGGNDLLFQAQTLDSAHKIRAIDGIPIAEHNAVG
jgi:hypothetical protein